jgi:hypothetical protein
MGDGHFGDYYAAELTELARQAERLHHVRQGELVRAAPHDRRPRLWRWIVAVFSKYFDPYR